MNAERFVRNGVISRQDITPDRLNKLMGKIKSPKDENPLLRSGLVTLQEIESRRSLHVQNEAGIEAKQEALEERIELATMSAEQKTLRNIASDMADPAKQQPGSGYHAILVGILNNAKNWPEKERLDLADKAVDFFRRNGSKKKSKEYSALIKDLRGE